jgi:hypothetical protein
MGQPRCSSLVGRWSAIKPQRSDRRWLLECLENGHRQDRICAGEIGGILAAVSVTTSYGGWLARVDQSTLGLGRWRLGIQDVARLVSWIVGMPEDRWERLVGRRWAAGGGCPGGAGRGQEAASLLHVVKPACGEPMGACCLGASQQLT